MPSPQANDTPWWFHPGSYMLLCFTPKRNHSIMTQCSVRGILAFRRGVDYNNRVSHATRGKAGADLRGVHRGGAHACRSVRLQEPQDLSWPAVMPLGQ